MTPDEPDAQMWRRRLASLTGNSAADAALIREFCRMTGITSAEVLEKMHAHGRINPQREEA
jgi:hypothetical protein